MLKDEDSEARSAAVCALGHLFSGDMCSVMPEHTKSKLIPMIDESTEDVRKCLAFALGNSSGSEDSMAVDILLKDSSCEVGNGLKQGWKCWKMENDKFADIFVRVMPSVIASHKLLCWASP